VATKTVALVGTVGVPARYGGFETLAEQLARAFDPALVALTIYCARNAYAVDERSGGFLGHRRHFVPLGANGLQSIAYDIWCIAHAVLHNHSALLVLGYSGSLALPFVRLFSPQTRIVVNIDGMEWRRAKWGRGTRILLRLLEWVAVRSAHAVVADNTAIGDLARAAYGIEPVTIAYGGDNTLVASNEEIAPSAAPQDPFHFSIARIEPENNAHMILAAYAKTRTPLVFVGNWAASAYGRHLRASYDGTPGLSLLDAIYHQPTLAWYRARATAYVHGHSVGGTNPSLVEAIFWADRVLAFDCAFNRATLEGEGNYFVDEPALAALLAAGQPAAMLSERLAALRERYRWATIAGSYAALLVGSSSTLRYQGHSSDLTELLWRRDVGRGNYSEA
jgi:glycosyltransferase involved in cell wall biosynthesis